MTLTPEMQSRLYSSISSTASPINKQDYIVTDTGNAISRKAQVIGSQNIILGGKVIVSDACILRGDLRRLTFDCY